MPSDTYTLTISEAGVTIPSPHASSHVTGGSDIIPTATGSTSGLMSAAIYNQHVANTTALAGSLTAANLAGGAIGTIPYQTSSGSTSMLSAGTAGYVLTANGSAAPTWAPVSLSALSGTLAVGDGGTGASTFAAGVVFADGTNTFTTVTKPTGDLVGTSATQTLTNKTLGSGTVFSSPIGVASGGTGAATFAAGILKASGTTTFTTVAAPAGTIVGTTDSQTLLNKTFSTGTNLGTPDSGTLTNCTGLPLTTGVTGTLPVANGGTGGLLPVANGGTGVATATGTGSVVLSTSPTLVTPILGTPTSGTLTNCTGLPMTTGVTGILPVANGGTGYGSDGIGTLSFDTTPDTGSSLTEGQLRWNATDKTLDLRMAGSSVTQQVGQEVLMRVHASVNISNGDVVYISGSNSGLPAVSLASNDSVTANKTLGMATEDITSGADGYITLMGLVRDLDLASYTAGDELWLGLTGAFTGIEPSYPAVKVRVGYVITATDGTGSLYFAPKFYENGTVNGTGKLGYLTGSGDAETQLTSKTTAVTLNKLCGQITTSNSELTNGASASFVMNNTTIEAGDVIILNHVSGGTFGNYSLLGRTAEDSATIRITNLTNGNLSDAIVIAFAVIKAVTS